MSDPYANIGAAKTVAGADPYARIGSGGSSTSTPAKKSGGGFFHAVGHVFTQGAADLENAAVQTPAALMEIHHALAAADPSNPTHFGHGDTTQLKALGKAYLKQTEDTLKHPLRHPGDTALLLAPGIGAVGRIARAGRAAVDAAKVGDVSGTVKALVTKPKAEPRILKVGDATVRGHYSRSSGAQIVQKATDKTLMKAAQTSPRAENLLHKRAAKWQERNIRVEDAKARAAGTRLAALGAKLKPEEQRALRLVAEEVPVDRRLGAQHMRMARATGAEVGRHQERIDLTTKAKAFLDAGPDGKPVFKPTATKLSKVYDALVRTSGDRETLLKNLDLMDEPAAQAAKTKAAQFAAGASYVKPTPGRLGKPSKALLGAQARVDRLQGIHDRLTAVQGVVPDKGASSARRESIAGALSVAKDELESLKTRAAARVKPTGAVGAEDISVSKGAPFIGNPVERTRITGRPKVSSTGTFGHTRPVGSLKTATGGSVEHALERNDTTRIVAERHQEAVRLSSIQRRVELVKKAGEKTPRRKDDVWVWTDKTVSSERIPAEVRKYLDNPDGFAKLPESEKTSIMDKLKAATFEKHDWHGDQEALDKFEKLAQEGKGVFVPRRMLGDAGKRTWNTAAPNPIVASVDAINNAQKAALIYLKVNYPVVQGLSNTAMGIIHQGFAYPINVTKAVRLDHAVGPEYAAVVDDIMGQGAVMQAAFHGEGAISHASQKLAGVMSRGVDKPARRSAFLHEADKAGYGTAAKLKTLLEDDSKVGDLTEVAQRAKEAIVDYGELSPFERNVVRRIFFVYPWQKGATKYAGHFLRDHPVQAAALGLAGQRGAQINDQTLGPVPSYLKGSFDVGGGLVNPSGVNFFQTPAQIGRAVGGLATGNPAASTGQDFLSPAPALLAALLSNRDSLGRPLTGNLGHKLQHLLVNGTPAYEAIKSATGHGTHSKTFPDPNDALWRFLIGGLHPRQYSKPALNQNAAREKVGR